MVTSDAAKCWAISQPRMQACGRGRGVPRCQINSFKPRPIAGFGDHRELLDELFSVMDVVESEDTCTNQFGGEIGYFAPGAENNIVPKGHVPGDGWGRCEFGPSPRNGKSASTAGEERGIVEGDFAQLEKGVGGALGNDP